eukprot:524378-Hanusia_phi.AAC.22
MRPRQRHLPITPRTCWSERKRVSKTGLARSRSTCTSSSHPLLVLLVSITGPRTWSIDAFPCHDRQ